MSGPLVDALVKLDGIAVVSFSAGRGVLLSPVHTNAYTSSLTWGLLPRLVLASTRGPWRRLPR